MKYIQNIAGKSGIYIISNDIDNRIYIGSAVSFRNRYAVHKRCMKYGNHGNSKLMNFAKKYGMDKLTFSPVFACEKQDLLKYEQEYLDKLQPFDENGFNILRVAGAPIGYKHTEESKVKMRNKEKRIVSDEEKKRLSEMKKGIPRSEITKQKLRDFYADRVKPVYIYSKDGFLMEADSMKDAAKKTGVYFKNIKSCLRGHSKAAGGMVFIYKQDVMLIDDISAELKRRFTNDRFRAILVTDIKTNTTKEYSCSSDFCREVNSKPPSVVSSILRDSPLYGRYYIKYK